MKQPKTPIGNASQIFDFVFVAFSFIVTQLVTKWAKVSHPKVRGADMNVQAAEQQQLRESTLKCLWNVRVCP